MKHFYNYIVIPNELWPRLVRMLLSTFANSIFTVAPLTEDDYSQADDHSDFSKKSSVNIIEEAKFQNEQNRSRHSVVKNNKSMEDGPLQLNLPLGSDGQGSHDSHNDSGYSTRLGFSAGPSPSLSGTKHLHFNSIFSLVLAGPILVEKSKAFEG